MKRLNKIWIALFFIIGMVAMIPASNSYAASAEVKLVVDNTEVTVGDKFFVSVMISSDTEFGDFETNLLYDSSILKYVKGSNVISGGDGFLRIRDLDTTSGETFRKYIVEFEAEQSGTANISFMQPVMVYDHAAGNEMAVSHNDLNIEVKAAPSTSNNYYLKSLAISPSLLNPAFDKNIFEYKTDVDYTTESLIVNAIPEDEKANVRISGNDSLKEGENNVIITVIAESGDVIEYSIKVNRDAAPEEVTELPETKPTEHGNFDLVKNQEDYYAIYNGRYKIISLGADVKIPDGYIKINMIISGFTIEAYAPINDVESDFVLVYAENELGEASFYQYDKVERTLQRYHENKVDAVETNVPAIDSSKTSNKNVVTSVIIIILSILCAVFALIIIRLTLNSNTRQKRK